MDEDADAHFDSKDPSFIEVTRKDIPERIQIMLKNRLAPSDQEIDEEAEWIFQKLIINRS